MLQNNSISNISSRINLSSLAVNLFGKFNPDQRVYELHSPKYMGDYSSESSKFFINSDSAVTSSSPFVATAVGTSHSDDNNLYSLSNLSISSASIASALTSMSSPSSPSLTSDDQVDERIMRLEDMKDFVSASGDVPIEFTMVILGYIMPFLLILTIFANTIVVIVLSRRHMITPTNIILLAMAISDMLTLIFPSPWYFYMYTLGNHTRLLFPTTACYMFHCMIEVVPAFFHTASIWLTLLLAIQRYICVCHPSTARTWCTGNNKTSLS